jgi:hypothetical protein
MESEAYFVSLDQVNSRDYNFRTYRILLNILGKIQ